MFLGSGTASSSLTRIRIRKRLDPDSLQKKKCLTSFSILKKSDFYLVRVTYIVFYSISILIVLYTVQYISKYRLFSDQSNLTLVDRTVCHKSYEVIYCHCGLFAGGPIQIADAVFIQWFQWNSITTYRFDFLEKRKCSANIFASTNCSPNPTVLKCCIEDVPTILHVETLGNPPVPVITHLG